TWRALCDGRGRPPMMFPSGQSLWQKEDDGPNSPRGATLMAWDFETEPEFQEKLDWTDAFVRREVEPLDLAFRDTAAAYDPREFRCRAVRDGDSWVIDGEKYFSSHADLAEFLIAMAITNPEVPVHQGASMFLVPRDTPGLNIVRLAGLGHEPLGHGHHAYIRYEGVRVPRENLLGGEGQGFV